MKEHEKTGRPAYLMVPRKLVVAWVVSYVVLFLMNLGSFQYTNYVARQLCGVISISNDSYKTSPPATNTGKFLAKEFDKISKRYHCK